MKMILLQDVKSVGKKGDLINASEGYAKNFLLPRKLAVEATKSNLNDYELKQKAEAKRKQEELEKAQATAKELEDKVVTIKVKTGGNGKLFGSVSTKEIAAACEKQLGLEIDKKKMVLPEPIKACGTTIVPVKLHREVTAKLTVKVQEA